MIDFRLQNIDDNGIDLAETPFRADILPRLCEDEVNCSGSALFLAGYEGTNQALANKIAEAIHNGSDGKFSYYSLPRDGSPITLVFADEAFEIFGRKVGRGQAVPAVKNKDFGLLLKQSNIERPYPKLDKEAEVNCSGNALSIAGDEGDNQALAKKIEKAIKIGSGGEYSYDTLPKDGSPVRLIFGDETFQIFGRQVGRGNAVPAVKKMDFELLLRKSGIEPSYPKLDKETEINCSGGGTGRSWL